jgi:hypothetical protein
MNSAEIFSALSNLGGMGLFSWVVYAKLRDMADAFKGLSDAIIKMEERGVRLARPTSSTQSPIGTLGIVKDG